MDAGHGFHLPPGMNIEDLMPVNGEPADPWALNEGETLYVFVVRFEDGNAGISMVKDTTPTDALEKLLSGFALMQISQIRDIHCQELDLMVDVDGDDVSTAVSSILGLSV